jgi:subtilisin family serine protease
MFMRNPISCESLEGRLFLTVSPNDASYASQWGLSAVAASTAWETSTGSSSVVVADIDTGLDYTHDDLYLNVWINQNEIPSAVKKTLKDADGDGVISFYDLNASANSGRVKDVDGNGRIDAADVLTRAKYGGWADGVDSGANGYVDDIIGWDFANNDRNPMDYDGHGTHTAGTMGATGNNGSGVSGVDWQVSLMAVKIFDDQGESASDRATAAAIRYSADNGARVSNNSWGGSYASSRIYNAIAYAGTKGQLFVVAAGNDGTNLDSRYYNDYPSEYALDNILVVGATTSGGSAAYYSNYGAANVDVFAPGSSVLSTYLNNDYERMSGTSMAAPHAAGAAALALAANSKLTAAQLKARIIAGADQSASLARRSVAGGELNVANTVANVTGTRYTSTSSSDAVVITAPGRRRRLFSSEVTEPATGVSPSAAAGAAPVVTAPAAPQPLKASSPVGGQPLLAAGTGGASTTSGASRPAVASATATAAREFSDRRVSATSAGYEPSVAGVGLTFNVDGVPVGRIPAGKAVDRVRRESSATPRVLPVPFANAAVGAVSSPAAVDERGMAWRSETAGEAIAAMEVGTSSGLGRVWSAMGAPGRAAVVMGGLVTMFAGGYAHVRRKLRGRRGRRAGAALNGVEPVEFDLRH